MTAAYSIITITDGTTTCTLTDNTNYSLTEAGWAPQVPTRRTSVLGGRPYTAVAEEIRLNIYGTTTAAALTSLSTLIRLIDQAAAWYADESVDPVTITYLPQGSELPAALVSLVYGFDGDRSAVSLPVTFNDRLMLYEISDVSLRFVRDGVWYGAEEENNVEITTQPTVALVEFVTSSSIPTPVTLRFGPFPDPVAIPAYDASYVLVANAANRLQVIDATGFITGAGPFNHYTTDADATHVPSDFGVLVYTPVDTIEYATEYATVTLAAGRRVGIVAAIRNDHATTQFQVRAEIFGPAERSSASTRPYLIDNATTDPRIVLLGIALCEETDYIGLRLHVTASANAGTLAFDYVALVLLDEPTSRILALGPVAATKFIEPGEESYLVVDPRPLESRSPRVRQEGASFDTSYAVPDYWRGDAFLLSDGDEIAAIFCGRTVGDKWTLTDGGGAWFSLFVGAVRRSAYLAPQ